MSNDAAKPLQTPIVKGGLRRIPFFNGRVLTAEDLQTEQDANATKRRRLGRATGTGVLDGLFVDQESDTTVTVQPGRALAPSGRVVELPKETDVSVVSRLEREETGETETTFKSCDVPKSPETSGTGAYLLFVEPASEPSGRTPRTRLGGDGAAGECGAQHRLEGARLRLVYLDTSDDALVPSPLADGEGEYDIQYLSEKVSSARESGEAPEPKHVSKLRNLLAHVCLSTPSTLTETADLYDTLRAQSRGNAFSTDDPVAELRDRAAEKNDGLEDAVPIGLLYWAHDRIEFVDVWSVRRRVHRSDPQRPAPSTARRRVETEAAIFQFQDHVEELVQNLGFRERVELGASELFPFLPPFGTIPNEEGDRAGFDVYRFFDTLSTREYLYVEGTTLSNLMSEATRVDSFRTDTEQLVWKYRVREDVQSSGDEQPSFVVFTSGFVPHAAEPQYNLSRFGYANYGPGVALR